MAKAAGVPLQRRSLGTPGTPAAWLTAFLPCSSCLYISAPLVCWDETEAGLHVVPKRLGKPVAHPLSFLARNSLTGSSLFAWRHHLGMGWCKAKLKLLFLPFVWSYSQGFCILLCSWGFVSELLLSPRAALLADHCLMIGVCRVMLIFVGQPPTPWSQHYFLIFLLWWRYNHRLWFFKHFLFLPCSILCVSYFCIECMILSASWEWPSNSLSRETKKL